MKKIIIVVLVFSIGTQLVQAQKTKLKVGINPSKLESSAALELQSVSQGFLPPRMNLGQITTIVTPVEGLSVFCVDCVPKALLIFDGTNWVKGDGQQPSAPPGIPPGVPTSPFATTGVGSASISFIPPAVAEDDSIVSYTVYSSPDGVQATGTSSPIVVPNLIAGTTYTFFVRATNSSGLTATSVSSNSVTILASVPQPPTSLFASAEIGSSASIAFTGPTNNGGTPITGYTVTSTPGGFTGTGTSSPILVSGLTIGTAYTFTMVATNSQGNSVASAPSNSFTPVATIPGVPAIGLATLTNGNTASISFVAPSSDGGSSITGYSVTSNPGGLTQSGSTSPILITGLVPGTTYSFRVRAINSVGISNASGESNNLLAFGLPGEPIAVTVLPQSDTSANVSFIPANTNGSSITSYTVTPSPATTPATFSSTASIVPITGLVSGTTYTFSVAATNAFGTGPATISAPFTPQATVPSSPTTVIASAGNAFANVSFIAPTNNGGSAIIRYTVTSNPGGITASGTASPITIAGLANNTAYTFSVVATNAVGSSIATNSNSVTPSASLVPSFDIAPSAAYSFRKVVSSYSGNVARVRAGSSNAVGDLTFDATGAVSLSGSNVTIISAGFSGLTIGTTVTLKEFLNAGSSDQSVFVTTWYDQSGNNVNVTQFSEINQPTLVFNGVLNSLGGKTAMFFDGNTDNLINTNTTVLNVNPQIINAVVMLNGVGANSIVSSDTPFNFGHGFGNGGSGAASVLFYRGLANGKVWSLNTITVATASFSTSNVLLDINGTRFVTRNGREGTPIVNADTSRLFIGSQGQTNMYAPAKYIAEVFIANKDWPSRVSEQDKFEQNQAAYYFLNILPSSPSNVQAVAGNATASVSFTPSTSPNITSYTVTSNPGDITAIGTSSPIQVNGLVNGLAYTFTVIASHLNGTSAASEPSSPVIPSSGAAGNIPSPPTNVIGSVANLNLSASVAFTASANNGNSAITSYTVTSNPGDISVSGSSSPIIVPGLVAGTSYTFTVVATNSIGNSTPSVPSTSVTAVGVPSKPELSPPSN